MKKNKKLLIGILIIILIIGAIVTVVRGINVGIEYTDAKEIQMYLARDINLDEVKDIVNSVFPDKKNQIYKLELFNDAIEIRVQNPTDEELNNLVKAINQKYNLEYSISDLKIIEQAKIDIRDIIVPYVVPTLIALVVIIVYMAVRFRELGIAKVILTPILAIILAEGVIFSIISICYFPINRYTMPIALAIFLITVTAVVAKFEKEVK